MSAVGTMIYFLCALTSVAAAALLLRSYRKNGVRLLLWSGLCFAGLALNNILLFIDVKVVPQTDLSLVRTLPAIAGVAIVIYGLVWESR